MNFAHPALTNGLDDLAVRERLAGRKSHDQESILRRRGTLGDRNTDLPEQGERFMPLSKT